MGTSRTTVGDAIQTQLWPIPTAAVVAALLLGVGLPEVDAAVGGELSPTASEWLFGGDAGAARTLLAAIASSLITVTALTFSLTVVTLQLASSQFSPRLLRSFASDQFVQVTLALFLSTFTFALTVLRTVRSAGAGDQSEFVPKFAVTVAFLLAVASVVALVLFLAHLTELIRVESMVRNVHREASGTMQALLSERDPGVGDQPPTLRPPVDAVRLFAGGDGFVNRLDQQRLLHVVVDEDAIVRLDVHPGTYVVRGTPLGTAWPLTPGSLSQEVADRIDDRVTGCVHLGFERTKSQDVGFGLRQLADVASKALSPGINDPTTAIHTLGHISSFLCDLTDRDLGPVLLRDQDDRARVELARPDLASYVDLGLSQPRRYGAQDPQLLERIAQVLLDLSHRVAPDQRPVVRDHLERLRATIDAQPFDSAEQTSLAALAQRIEERLGPPSTQTHGC
ncbi:MAG: DUF2254 domain-containing protein [Ornithinimicrobium sp.]|uniref:DUF2254 domain-containing protein n=1 Tax=Ornithinimicrobium sp. TaxID=1977084 RepID=UPI003D9B8DEB